jgi:hypothetical protein
MLIKPFNSHPDGLYSAFIVNLKMCSCKDLVFCWYIILDPIIHLFSMIPIIHQFVFLGNDDQNRNLQSAGKFYRTIFCNSGQVGGTAEGT